MIPGYPLIPGPPFLLDHLLGLLFILHILFMNFVVAATAVMVWHLWSRREDGRQFAAWLSAALPVAFTFAINFGVASLLFTQVLFAEKFFTANIILGNTWLAIIALLMTAFYGAYIIRNRLRKESGGRAVGGGIGIIIVALVWSIAAIMIANYFITTDAAHWHELWARPRGALLQQTFVPRMLHFITGSFALTGFWMVWIAWWRERHGQATETLRGFRRQGLFLAAGATGVQISVGIWFLIWQPTDVWDKLFSGSFPATIWITGVTTGLLMLGCLIVAAVFPDRKFWRKLSTGLLAWTLIGMVAGRDVVRQAAFAPDYSVSKLPHATQLGPMFLFFMLLLAGVAVLLWMLFMISGKPRKG